MVSCCLKRTLLKGIILNIDGKLKNDEENGVIKNVSKVLRFPYDSTNCIRFGGYVETFAKYHFLPNLCVRLKF